MHHAPARTRPRTAVHATVVLGRCVAEIFVVVLIAAAVGVVFPGDPRPVAAGELSRSRPSDPPDNDGPPSKQHAEPKPAASQAAAPDPAAHARAARAARSKARPNGPALSPSVAARPALAGAARAHREPAAGPTDADPTDAGPTDPPATEPPDPTPTPGGQPTPSAPPLPSATPPPSATPDPHGPTPAPTAAPTVGPAQPTAAPPPAACGSSGLGAPAGTPKPPVVHAPRPAARPSTPRGTIGVAPSQPPAMQAAEVGAIPGPDRVPADGVDPIVAPQGDAAGSGDDGLWSLLASGRESGLRLMATGAIGLVIAVIGLITVARRRQRY